MLIEVTEEDIELGQPNNGRICPVALALLRCTGASAVAVEYDLITLALGINLQFYRTSIVVNRFIENFDRGNKVWPIKFDMPVPVKEEA